MSTLEKKKITDLSDGEFLSFLYAERERENSLRQYQGWNIWALVGAMATVICTGYYILKENVTSIDFVQILYLVSGALALLLCHRPVVLLFSKERGVDYQKIKTLKEVVPCSFLGLAFVVATTFSVLVSVVDRIASWSYVAIGWIVAAALYLFAIIMVFINRNKIVKAYIDRLIFVNYQCDKWYSIIVCLVLSLVWTGSFKNITWTNMGASEFEFSICIIVFVMLTYLLLKVYLSEKTTNKIDVLIDNYVYNGYSKEVTFKMLRIGQMGNTVLESCANEMIDIGKGLESFDKKKLELEEIGRIFEAEDIDINSFKISVLEMEEIRLFLKSYYKRVIDLKNKLLQIEKQIPWIKDDIEYKQMVTICNGSYASVENLVNQSISISTKIGKWYNKYYCEKYGGYCEKECEHRHDRKKFRLRVKKLCRQMKSSQLS